VQAKDIRKTILKAEKTIKVAEKKTQKTKHCCFRREKELDPKFREQVEGKKPKTGFEFDEKENIQAQCVKRLANYFAKKSKGKGNQEARSKADYYAGHVTQFKNAQIEGQ
jgi:hypothetical protein